MLYVKISIKNIKIKLEKSGLLKKERIMEILNEKKEIFFQASDSIWETPELRFAVDQSVQQHYSILEKEGFTIEKGIGGMRNAYVATYGSGSPIVGILGEYDALSNLSQQADLTKQEPITKGANGHGCGHNLLGMGAVAGAVGAKEFLKETGGPGTIKLFGCPAEEGGCGKSYIARAGLFDELDLALSWHPMDQTGAWGASSLAVYHVNYHFKGISSHAAGAPELGRSALDAAELMNIGVQFLREHIIDDARIHYAFTDTGGTSPNVVQSSASLFYYVRAPKMEQATEIYERVTKIAEGAALMTGTTMEVSLDSACYEYIPNKLWTAQMHENLYLFDLFDYSSEELAYEQGYYDTIADSVKQGIYHKLLDIFPDKSVEELKEYVSLPICQFILPLSFDGTGGGSTDVGDVSWICPTAQVWIGCEPLGSAPHSWQWVANGKSSVAHKGLLNAGKAIALTAIDAFTSPERIKKGKEEHLRNLKGKTYKCAIPNTVMPDC